MESISAVNIQKTVEKSVIDVFDAMLSMPVASIGPDSDPPPGDPRGVAGVKFVGGLVGIVNIPVVFQVCFSRRSVVSNFSALAQTIHFLPTAPFFADI
jgi:hypothetical protein